MSRMFRAPFVRHRREVCNPRPENNSLLRSVGLYQTCLIEQGRIRFYFIECITQLLYCEIIISPRKEFMPKISGYSRERV